MLEDDLVTDGDAYNDGVKKCIGFMSGIDMTPSDKVTPAIDMNWVANKCVMYSNESIVLPSEIKKTFQRMHGAEADVNDKREEADGANEFVWHPLLGQMRVHDNLKQIGRLPHGWVESILGGYQLPPPIVGEDAQVSNIHRLAEPDVPYNGAVYDAPKPPLFQREVSAPLFPTHNLPYNAQGRSEYDIDDGGQFPPNIYQPSYGNPMFYMPPHGMQPPSNVGMQNDGNPPNTSSPEASTSAAGASTSQPGLKYGPYGQFMFPAAFPYEQAMNGYPTPPGFNPVPPVDIGTKNDETRSSRSNTSSPQPSASTADAKPKSSGASYNPYIAYAEMAMQYIPPNVTVPPIGGGGSLSAARQNDGSNSADRSSPKPSTSTADAGPTPSSANTLPPGPAYAANPNALSYAHPMYSGYSPYGASMGVPSYGHPMQYMPFFANGPPVDIGGAKSDKNPNNAGGSSPKPSTSTANADNAPNMNGHPMFAHPMSRHPMFGHPMFGHPMLPNFNVHRSDDEKETDVKRPSRSNASSSGETASGCGANSPFYDSLPSVSDGNASISEAKNTSKANTSSVFKTPCKANTSKVNASTDSCALLIEDMSIASGDKAKRLNLLSNAQKMAAHAKPNVSFSDTLSEMQRSSDDFMSDDQLDDTHKSRTQRITGTKRRSSTFEAMDVSDVDENDPIDVVTISPKRIKPNSPCGEGMSRNNSVEIAQQPPSILVAGTSTEKPSSETVSRIPDHLRLPCKPSKFVHTYRSIIPDSNRNDENDANYDKDLDSYKENQAKPNNNVDNVSPALRCDFKTGTEELKEQYAKKYGNPGTSNSTASSNAAGRTLGARPGKTVRAKFVSPVQNQQQQQPQQSYSSARDNQNAQQQNNPNAQQQNTSNSSHVSNDKVENVDERLKNIDPIMIERIQNEIMHNGTRVGEYQRRDRSN